jgi:hypothetical protein
MNEVDGNIKNKHVSILIGLGSIHSYLDPKLVDIFHLKKSRLKISWLVQLATGIKRRINEIVIGCPIYINGVCFPFRVTTLRETLI